VLVLAILALVYHRADADVSVLVDTRASSTEWFFVSVSTRHADLHNGYSRERFQGLVQANKRTRVPIDFYVTLVGHGVYAYHPEYFFESAVTHSRWDDLPILTPRRWDVILEGLGSLPLAGAGPSYFNALGHVEFYRDRFVAALDRADRDPDPADLPRFGALLARADTLVTFPPAETGLQRHDHAQIRARRAKVLPDIKNLLALKRSQRVAMVAFRELTIGPKPMLAALARDPGFPALQAFVASVHAQQPVSRLPREHVWQDQTGLRFTYILRERYQLKRNVQLLDCFRGTVIFDGRPIADGAFDDLVKQVNADICLESDGSWRLQTR
jgi:hypothetical protein